MRDRRKFVILVGDGMGDLPVEALAGRTPLEAADTPAMDDVAGRGELFRLVTIPPGFPPGSDVANLSLLGYRPQECYSGRAPLEAASLGVELGGMDTAFRCNLVTIRHEADGAVIMEDYSAGHIGSDEARELILGLNERFGSEAIRLYPGVSYRHLLVYRGEPKLRTVPPHDHTGRDVTAYWKDYGELPVLQELIDNAGRYLSQHPVNKRRAMNGLRPANAIWLWGEGKKPVMPTIPSRYALQGALISAVDLLKGLGVCAGLEIINVPGATGYLDTNYAGKAQAALAALERHDFVFVHVEAPDEASHEGSLDKKLQAIEDFDARIVAPIMQGLLARQASFRLAVVMDHYTPLALRTHAELPVPVAIFDSERHRSGAGPAYCEKNAAAAPLLEDGPTFFHKLLDISR